LVAAFWEGTTVGLTATLSPGSAITSGPLIFVASGSSGATFLNSTSRAAAIGMYTVATNGIAAANLLTISGLTGMTAGTADIMVVQISSGVLKESAHVSVTTEDLISRLAQLELRLSNTLRITNLQEPCSPDEFKTTDCLMPDLKTCANCRDSAALIGSIYCHRCAQAIGAKRGLKVAWNPDS
jgi:uncharacterized protein YjdB